MKVKDRMTTAIKSRKDLEPTLISLRKLLASGGMEYYLDLCSDRLAENEKIDGQDTQINFADFPDILFTSDGLFDCRHILENYLPAESLIDAWQELLKVERRNWEINILAKTYRTASLSKLWELYKKFGTVEDKKAGRIAQGYLMLELWNRSFFAGIWRKAKEILGMVYVNVRYRKLLGIVRKAADNM